MKRRYIIMMVMSIGLGLSGCGGGNGGGTTATQEETNSTIATTPDTPKESNNTTPNTPEETNTSTSPSTVLNKINIEVQCTIPPNISEYLELQSGDKIVKEGQESRVKVYHDENNLKYICLESGQAFVQRSE
jgi:hypothetical protein